MVLEWIPEHALLRGDARQHHHQQHPKGRGQAAAARWQHVVSPRRPTQADVGAPARQARPGVGLPRRSRVAGSWPLRGRPEGVAVRRRTRGPRRRAPGRHGRPGAARRVHHRAGPLRGGEPGEPAGGGGRRGHAGVGRGPAAVAPHPGDEGEAVPAWPVRRRVPGELGEAAEPRRARDDRITRRGLWPRRRDDRRGRPGGRLHAGERPRERLRPGGARLHRAHAARPAGMGGRPPAPEDGPLGHLELVHVAERVAGEMGGRGPH
mmetsp:Transcript_24456/g.68711  ORF Transcript_24456/g.68711 Transcript_24456/m.68711 type:complete len:264 (+) Transcript_24456:115-906(+)